MFFLIYNAFSNVAMLHDTIPFCDTDFIVKDRVSSVLLDSQLSYYSKRPSKLLDSQLFYTDVTIIYNNPQH